MELEIKYKNQSEEERRAREEVDRKTRENEEVFKREETERKLLF